MPRSASIEPRTSLLKFDIICGLRGGGVPRSTAHSEAATTHHSFRQLETARSRLYRRRFWPPNSHFSAFFKIYKIYTLLHRSKLKMLVHIMFLCVFRRSYFLVLFLDFLSSSGRFLSGISFSSFFCFVFYDFYSPGASWLHGSAARCCLPLFGSSAVLRSCAGRRARATGSAGPGEPRHLPFVMLRPVFAFGRIPSGSHVWLSSFVGSFD